MPPLFSMDDYEDCMLLKQKSLYCRLTYELEPINKDNSSQVWKIVKVCTLLFLFLIID